MRRFMLCLAVIMAVMPVSFAWGDVAIDAANFPDDVFRQYVSENFDSDGDEVLNAEEIDSVTWIDVGYWGISSLKGIEYFTGLTSLYCSGNQLTTLDVSNCTALTWLNCSYNQLASIDVSRNTALTDLYCYGNHLTALDLSKCAELMYLNCENNQLTELDVSNCPNLTEITCDDWVFVDNGKIPPSITTYILPKAYTGQSYEFQIIIRASKPMTLTHTGSLPEGLTIDNSGLISGTTSSEGSYSITLTAENSNGKDTKTLVLTVVNPSRAIAEINEENFPDEYFRDYVIRGLDLDSDGVLNAYETYEVKSLDIDSWGIYDLKGIEYFTSLTYLNVRYGQLTTLDLSKNIALTELYCYGNQLTELDLSKNTALTSLSCVDNHQLTELDLSKNTALTRLYCVDNRQLTKLNVSNNTALTYLDCYSNQLTELDVSNCTALTYLYCYSNQLTALDVSNNTALETLYCSYNQLTALDVSNNTALETLYCENNLLTRLDVSNNTALHWLNCENNMLTGLDLSKNTGLYNLYCRGNKYLAIIDLSECYSLWEWYCDESTIVIRTSLDGIMPMIATSEIPPAISGRPYYMQFGAAGASPMKWTIKGKLPEGLTFSESGIISGTPTKTGKSSFTVKAENDYGDNSEKFSLQVIEPVSITTTSLKAATIGKNYNFTLKAKGTKTITWSATGLPEGLTITEKGRISGKPAVYGKFDVNVQARNDAGITEKSFQLEVKAIEPKLTGSLKGAELSRYYISGLKLSAGSQPVTWSVSGTMPDGLTINPSSGIISGIPTSYAKDGYKFTITASNDAGKKSKTVTLKVKGTAPKITTAQLPDATIGTYYSAQLSYSGSGPVTWSASGLPNGLQVYDNRIEGYPYIDITGNDSEQRFDVTIFAENPVGTATKTLKLKVILFYAGSNNTEKSFADNSAGVVADDVHRELVNNHSAGYVVVSELGTISCDEEGMYEFDAELYDNAPKGWKLAYMAGSDNPSDDDEIAEFYDESGEEVSAVPESRRITVSIWLNPGVVYKPLILAIRE